MKLVVADANVLLSAIAAKAASKVFRSGAIEVYTTAFTWTEVLKYLPVFRDSYSIPEELLEEGVQACPIHIVEPEAYRHQIVEAVAVMKDPDDVELAALALHLDVPVWSNDNHFKGFPTGRFTTAELLKKLDILNTPLMPPYGAEGRHHGMISPRGL